MSEADLDETERLFSAALELAPQDRADFIERECAGKPALLAELRLLLNADLTASTVLFPSPAVWLPPDTLAAGQLVADRYRLLRPIGEGGLGTVWSAEQIAPVQRRVALKFIRHDLNSRRVIARFAAERAALALMDHPGIARIFDAGVWIDRATSGEGGNDPRPYVVMEFVDGPPITVHCDRGATPIRERVRLVAEVCRAVHHAHQKGILHRDLKPSNILTTHVDGVAVPKVIDFGIAKAMDDAVLPDRTMTRVGQFVGTPAYMAPEQLRGDVANTDVRADIFALGVVLHELLAGCLPHDRSSSGALSPSSHAHESGATEARAPSSSVRRLGAEEATRVAQARGETPRSLRRRLKGELDWIVGRATASEPDRRYDSANELAADLSRWLVGEPIVAGPPSIRYRARKFVQRNTAAVVVAAILVLALIGGLVGTSVGLFRANAAEAIAQQARHAAEQSARAEAEQRNAAVAARTRAELNAYRAELAAASAAIVADDIAAAQGALAATDPARRNWEWQRLAFVTDQADMVIRSEVHRPFGIALSPDDSELIVTFADGSIRSYDAETGAPRVRAETGLPIPLRLAVSPRGDRLIAMGYSDPGWTTLGFVLLDWPSGKVITSGRGYGAIDPSPSRSGRFVVTESIGVDLRIVDLATGTTLATVGSPISGGAGRAEFAAHSAHLFVYDRTTGDVAAVDPTGHATRTWRMPVLDNGTLIRGEFYAGADRTTGHGIVLRLDDPQWRRTIIPPAPGARLQSIAISPDGRLAAAKSSRSGTTVLHDLVGDRAIGALRGHRGATSYPVFTSDSRRLFIAAVDGTIRRWRLDSVHDEFRIEPNSGTGGFGADFSANASLLASGGWGSVELWDSSTGALRWTVHATSRFVELLRFSPDGRRLLIAERSGAIRIHSVADGAVLHELLPIGADPTAIVWDPLDRFVAIADIAGSVSFIDPTSGAPIAEHKVSEGPISALALSPDGSLFAAGTGLEIRWTDGGSRFTPDPGRTPELVIGRIDGTLPPRSHRLPSGATALVFAADVGSSPESASDSGSGHLYVGTVTGWLAALEVDAELSIAEVPGRRWALDGSFAIPPVGALLDAPDALPTSNDTDSGGSASVVAIMPASIPGRIVVSLLNGTTSVLIAGVDAPVLRLATSRPRALAFDRATETLMVSGSVPLQAFGIAHPDPALVATRDRVIAVRAIVDPLVKQHRLTDAVLRALEADPTIDDDIRADAMSYAAARGEHLAWVVSDAIEIARSREIDAAARARFRQALDRLDHVAEQWQALPGRFSFVRAVLLMRLSDYEAASAELDLHEQSPTTRAATDLGVLAVRAMLARRQGDDATAQSIWSTIRARVEHDGPPSGEGARYVREAEREFERTVGPE